MTARDLHNSFRSSRTLFFYHDDETMPFIWMRESFDRNQRTTLIQMLEVCILNKVEYYVLSKVECCVVHVRESVQFVLFNYDEQGISTFNMMAISIQGSFSQKFEQLFTTEN